MWAGAIGIGGTMDNYSANDVYLTQTGNSGASIHASGGNAIGWTSGADASQSLDTGLTRGAAKQVRFGDGGANSNGWYTWSGTCKVTADQTESAATLTSTTCTISNLAASEYYGFTCELFLSDSVAAEGAKIDFNGGSATATTFIAQSQKIDTALNGVDVLTALNGPSAAPTFTGTGAFEVHGTILVNGAGTFLPRFAQNTHASGTLTLKKGSRCMMWDMGT
jgi:hypothetical protein